MSEREDEDAAEEPVVIDAAEEVRMLRIMQYCDGNLLPREAAAVKAEIARDPETARLAAAFAAGAEAARSAWADLAAGPVPLHLARNVVQAARTQVRVRARPAPLATWRIAAALVLGCGLGALGLVLLQRGSEQGLRLAGVEQRPNAQLEQVWMPALLAALRKDPEPARVAFSGTGGAGSAVAVTRWFDTATGLRCAEFVKSIPGTADTGGIACRNRDGGWDVIEQDH